MSSLSYKAINPLANISLAIENGGIQKHRSQIEIIH